MASALDWIPDSLYNSAIAAVVANFTAYQKDVRTLHGNVLFDIYYKLYKEGLLCLLGQEFSQLEIFNRLLKLKEKRYLLHHCFQALMDHSCSIASQLADSYKMHSSIIQKETLDAKKRAINLGLRLGSFLNDAGWYRQSEKTTMACMELSDALNKSERLTFFLECYSRLLHARYSYCDFHKAQETYVEALSFVTDLCSPSGNSPLNLAAIYSEFSTYFFLRHNYNESFKWSVEALKEVATCKCPKAIVAVLRQATKACIVKCQFKRAAMLIKQAYGLSQRFFGKRHPVMACALRDYGFYLLHNDSLCHSIKVYHAALETQQCIYGGQNLLVAMAHEDLALALYIHEYKSGRFKDAIEHAEKGMEIMSHLLPEDHLLLASSKRIKALILEEIALDNHNKAFTKLLLLESQELHTSALHLVQEIQGEMNVQTAKHYGNLGRLYQSMQRLEEAREMHLKAIKIKEHVLGPEDHEVALSIGHLASLYNYDMLLFEKAEELYLRSISITIKLFGNGYSGLDFDYRGLIRVYHNLNNETEANKYRDLLREWKSLRDRTSEIESETSPLKIEPEILDQEIIYQEFMSIM